MADPSSAPETPPQSARFKPASDDFVRGATVRPQYVERNPSMWAVGETDLDALSIISVVSTAAFAIGSFFLGMAANILVAYGGTDKLTDIGHFMLHKATWVLGIAALIFYCFGLYFARRKGSLWEKIKKESGKVKQQ